MQTQHQGQYQLLGRYQGQAQQGRENHQRAEVENTMATTNSRAGR
jgi:hypothetical protein